jgi:Uncharacterized protein conserved in bacteria
MSVLRTCSLILALLAGISVLLAGKLVGFAAETARDIEWTTLLSPDELALREQTKALQIRTRALSTEEQRALPRIATEFNLKRLLASGQVTKDRLNPSQRELIDHPPSELYPEAARVWREMDDLKQKIVTLQNTPNPSLAGQRVRLSGYLLPLEFDGGEVSEFLLVPFVGACIHVPPPPPNQIVHVMLAGRYAAHGAFAPVTVTGTMSVSPGKADLFLADGTAPVEHGYRLDAEVVSAAKTE